MRFLIDTNIVIPLEPTAPEHAEQGTASAAQLVRVAQLGGHVLVLHPASLEELLADSDEQRLALRTNLVAKYPPLEAPPAISGALESELGVVNAGDRHYVDHLLLAALASDAVDFLVTEDGLMHRKAERLDLADRVFTTTDAVGFLDALTPHSTVPPPMVEEIQAHELNGGDPIFDSFREEYEGFDEWLTKCKRSGRRAWVIRDTSNSYAAICIVKDDDNELGPTPRTLKICSLKVGEDFGGSRFGELMLKAVFRYAAANGYGRMFLTVFDRHDDLIDRIEQFGFARLAYDKQSTGERYYAKPLLHVVGDEPGTPLEFHIRYGPPALTPDVADVFLLPVVPKYHRALFPDAEPDSGDGQLALIPLPAPRPYGNAIRKAYLSNSASRSVRGGATLLFYRSTDEHAIFCVGVVESVRILRDAEAVTRFVGQRTVYNFPEIERMCDRGEVVCVLFRHDRVLEAPITIEEMLAQGLASRAPQSIQRVPEEAHRWLQNRLGA